MLASTACAHYKPYTNTTQTHKNIKQRRMKENTTHITRSEIKCCLMNIIKFLKKNKNKDMATECGLYSTISTIHRQYYPKQITYQFETV
jgi:hypothetical protein